MAEYVRQALPTVIGAARYGVRSTEYYDRHILLSDASSSPFHPGVIGPLSQRVGALWQLWSVVSMVATEEDAANMLLLWHRIEEIALDVSFKGVELSSLGR